MFQIAFNACLLVITESVFKVIVHLILFFSQTIISHYDIDIFFEFSRSNPLQDFFEFEQKKRRKKLESVSCQSNLIVSNFNDSFEIKNIQSK